MRYNSSIQQLQLDPGYETALRIVSSVVGGNAPAMTDLVDLYGVQQAPIMHGIFGRFLDEHREQMGTPRPHRYNAPTEISDARSHVEDSPDYQRLQSKVLFNELPEISEMEAFFGPYAEQVRTIFGLFLHSNRQRKCGITSIAHLNRVGAVVRRLGLDAQDQYVYTTVAALHDALEDLLEHVSDKHGNLYGVRGYQAFLNRYISPELHAHMRMITNFYDLLLAMARKQIESEDKFLSKENLLYALEDMYKHERVDIHPYIEKIHYALEDAVLNGEVFAQAKWLCYCELYIREMAIFTHTARNYRTYEIKAVDLSDNAHGRDALALDARVKNLIKQQIYVNYGSMLNSTWHGLNNRVAELQEDALLHAEHIIVQDLLQRQSYMDFAISTMKKMLALRTILFQKEKKVVRETK